MKATSGTDDFPPLLAVIEELQQALDRGMHLQLSREQQTLPAIEAMAKAILRIRRSMNSLVPVHRLPAELLTLIFEYAIFRDDRMALWNAGQSPGDIVQPHCADIVRITHVCHEWRGGALASPRLWTHIDNHYHPAKLTTFLSRSQAAPLTLHFARARFASLVRLTQICGNRLRRLDVGHVGNKVVFPLLQLDGSSLECATITADVGEPRRAQGQPAPGGEPTAFEQSMSLLKGLAMCVLHGFWMPNAHFPNLTHLFLDQSTSPGSGPLLQSLRTFLSNTPRLQILHLASLPTTSVRRPATPESTLPLVALPDLKLFGCSFSHPDTSLRLLSLLQIPENSHVYIEHYSLNPIELSELHRPYSQAWGDGLVRLEVTVAGNTVRVVADGDRSGFWIEGRQFPINLQYWICQLKAVLPLESIQTLNFFGQSAVGCLTEDLLREVLDELPSLATLRFPGQSSRPTSEISELRKAPHYIPHGLVFRALMPGDARASVRCPLLTALYLEGQPDVLDKLSPDLTNVLAARARAGVPVKSLSLRVLQSTGAPLKKRGRDANPLEPRLRVRAAFSAATAHIEELHLELEAESDEPTPREPAGSMPGTQWDFSEEMERYWIVPQTERPPWLKSSP